MVKQKSQYIADNGLAGAMFWELSGDKVGADSLVGLSANAFGTLDQTPNHISCVSVFASFVGRGAELKFLFRYPNSKWDNIRSNMGQKV